MKTLIDVARRLEGMAQNAADRAETFAEDCGMKRNARASMVEFMELAETIRKHISECPTCKPSQSR